MTKQTKERVTYIQSKPRITIKGIMNKFKVGERQATRYKKWAAYMKKDKPKISNLNPPTTSHRSFAYQIPLNHKLTSFQINDGLIILNFTNK